jgi:hypothetical protein
MRGVAVAVSGNILRTPHFAEPFVVLLIGQLLPYSPYLFEDIIATKIPCNFVFLTHLGGIKSRYDKSPSPLPAGQINTYMCLPLGAVIKAGRLGNAASVALHRQ